MRAVLIDTGPLYALAAPTDQYHERAQYESERILSDQLDVILLYPILVEAYTLILRRFVPSVAHHWLEMAITSANLFNPNEEDYLQAASRVRVFQDQRLTLCDGLLSILSERLEIPVWSYDHHFDILRVSRWPSGSVL